MDCPCLTLGGFDWFFEKQKLFVGLGFQQTPSTMKLSLFSDYSLRVLMYAGLADGVFLLDDVAQAYGISRHHLAQVVHHLGKLGYLQTRRGRGGGIQLARPAEDIRIGKLVRQTEDQPVWVECFDPETNTCRIEGACRLKGILAEAMNGFYAILDRYSLQDLIEGRNRDRMRQLLGSGPLQKQDPGRPR